MTILNILGRGAAAAIKPAADRSFKFDLPGKVPDVTFCSGTCSNATELNTSTGGGKWMYDEAARSFGYNPTTARRNPEQNAQVETRMYATINATIDAAKARGNKGGSVEWHSQFRSSLGAERQKTEQAQTLKLNEQARLASLPGASVLADPTIRGAVQGVVNIELRALKLFRPELVVAAQSGLAAGAVVALIAADQREKISAIPDQLDRGTLDNKPDQKPLTPLAMALDTDKDGKMVCKEIGDWVPDTGRHSPNSKAYQDYVTGKPGTDFHVPRLDKMPLKFDGCKDTPDSPLLLEAKGMHGAVITGDFSDEPARAAKQGTEQMNVAKALGVRNELHVQMKEEVGVFEKIYRGADVTTPVKHVPMPLIK